MKKRLTYEETNLLVTKLKQGDKTARDILIRSHIPLAKSLASKFVNKAPHLLSELFITAQETLVEKVERIRLGKSLTVDNNIGAFLNSSIVFALKHLIYKHKQKRKIANIEPKITHNLALDNLLKEEILLSDEFSDIEKRIISLRIKGYTDMEIGNSLNLSQQRICVIKNKLRERLDNYL